jgi:hypothetical protein
MGLDGTVPSAWKHYGYGNGGISFSIDPNSGQANLSIGLSPASAAPTTAAPTININGGINGQGVDSWAAGISLSALHGTVTATTVTFSE